MSSKGTPEFVLHLPPLDGATAAWMIDLCGLLQVAIWQSYGDAIEAHWATNEPGQTIYGPLMPSQPKKR